MPCQVLDFLSAERKKSPLGSATIVMKLTEFPPHLCELEQGLSVVHRLHAIGSQTFHLQGLAPVISQIALLNTRRNKVY